MTSMASHEATMVGYAEELRQLDGRLSNIRSDRPTK